MVRRKGEITSRKFDAGWPYQIALRADERMMLFAISAKTYRLHRAATRSFAMTNGGMFGACRRPQRREIQGAVRWEFMEPKDRPRWSEDSDALTDSDYRLYGFRFRLSLFNVANSRAHSLKGTAGEPPIRAPGFTLDLTVALAAI
jgi:hypothetical protein